MLMVDPQRGQKLRVAVLVARRSVGLIFHWIPSVAKCAQLWYGAPDCLRQVVQWQLTSILGEFKVV
jgi:hypothetical protein